MPHSPNHPAPRMGAAMDVSQLRIAIISGNYNMVRDGPTQALGKLVDHLLAQGAAVRIFCPTVENPQVDQPGEIVSIPSIAIPGRGEYRIPIGLVGEARQKFEDFRPNIVHVASPDRAARQAAKWARDHGGGGAGQRSHALRNLSAILPPRLHGAGGRGVAAQALPPLRRAGRAVGRHGRRAARPADAPRHRHLVARGGTAPSSIPEFATLRCAAVSASATTRLRLAS